MSTSVRDRPTAATQLAGGGPARRAVVRWAWRLFRREWRQQLAVIGLLIVSVAAAVFAIAFAADAPSSPSAEFGTADHMLTASGSPAQQAAAIAAARAYFGPIEVIEHAKAAIPGAVNSVDVRAERPDGRYSSPMLRLDLGHYPAAGQVAVTAGVAAIYRLHVGSVWNQGDRPLRVVGIVENPANFQDEFALVAPGQLDHPDQVIVLFDTTAKKLRAARLPAGVQLSTRPPNNPGFPPAAVLVFDTIALLFVGLIAVAGFAVLAQRRLRALGMLHAVGAADRHVRLVLLANGAVVGLIAALTGTLAGLAGWVALVPRLQTVVEHRIAALSLPWWEVAVAIALAVMTAVAAAWWPARAAARVPPVVALSGRPPGPQRGRRSVALGGILLAIGLSGIALSHQGKTPALVIGGLVVTAIGALLTGPTAIGGLAAVSRHAPVAVRLAVRDLARYRARSGGALGAITVATGIVAAIAISAAAAAHNESALGEVGWPNLPADQLMIYLSPAGPTSLPAVVPAVTTAQLSQDQRRVNQLAAALHVQHVLPLDAALGAGAAALPEGTVTGYTTAALARATVTPSGEELAPVAQLYVATPAVLHFYGVNIAAIRPDTDVLTARAGLGGTKLLYFGSLPCAAAGRACASAQGSGGSGTQAPLGRGRVTPTIQMTGLPRYVSAPNTLLTEHAMAALQLHRVLAGWLVQAPTALTAQQVADADHWATATGLTVETPSRSAQAGLASVSNYAVGIGALAVLAVLAMTVGLIRSETSSDLRVLAAAGASGATRRLLTGATAAALALLGAVLGTAAAYLGILAWNRGVHSLSAVPVTKLAVLIAGLPFVALIAGWLLAGREPAAMAQQPLE